MAHARELLYNALRVITQDPRHHMWLEGTDPKALAQAEEAIRTFEEEAGFTNEPKFVVDLYVPFSCAPEGAETAEQAAVMALNTFAAGNIYDQMVEFLSDTVFSRSDSEWRTEVGEG